MIDLQYGPNTEAVEEIFRSVSSWTPEQVEAVRLIGGFALAVYGPGCAFVDAWRRKRDTGVWRRDAMAKSLCGDDLARLTELVDVARYDGIDPCEALLDGLYLARAGATGEEISDLADMCLHAPHVLEVAYPPIVDGAPMKWSFHSRHDHFGYAEHAAKQERAAGMLASVRGGRE